MKRGSIGRVPDGTGLVGQAPSPSVSAALAATIPSRGPAAREASLAELSAAASGGEWFRCGQNRGGCSCGYIFSDDGQAYALKALTLDDDVDPVSTQEKAIANAAFVVALVNRYRSGTLVEVAPQEPRPEGIA